MTDTPQAWGVSINSRFVANEDGGYVTDPIVMRSVKGSELEHAEMDGNFAWLFAISAALSYGGIINVDWLMTEAISRDGEDINVSEAAEYLAPDYQKIAANVISALSNLEDGDATMAEFRSIVNGDVTNFESPISMIDRSSLHDGQRVFDKDTKKTLTYIAADATLYDAMGNIEYVFSDGEDPGEGTDEEPA